MSVALLQTLGDFLANNSLTTGYTVRYFRYTVDDIQSNTPIMLIRKSGSGIMNTAVQNIDFRITIFCDANSTVDASNRLNAIAGLFAGTDKPDDVLMIKVLSSPSDPEPMDDNKFYLTMNIRVTIGTGDYYS